MNVTLERTRIILTDYSDNDKLKIENLVASDDTLFMYYDIDKAVIALPAGMTDSIKRMFPTTRIVDNSSTYWDYAVIDNIEHNALPRNDMQRDYIKFTMDNVNNEKKVGGVLPPGAGKTFMACYAAIKTGLKTLIIAPTTSVKGQWADTLTGMFGVNPSKVKVVNAPKDFIKTTADFVITTQSSLGALNKSYDLEAIMKDNKFGTKIIDEAHMFFQNTINIDASSCICHNWYLTGTFGRSSSEEDKIFKEMFGDIHIFRVADKTPTMLDRKPGDVYGQKPHMNVKMIWTSSNMSPEQRHKVSGSMRYSRRAGKWMRYGISISAYTKIVIPEDGSMTKFLRTILDVIKIAHETVTYGKMLILTPTISSATILMGHVKRMIPDQNIGSIHSRNTAATNTKVKAECDIIISTVKSAGTGFDVQGLSKLVVAEQFKSWIVCDQVSGRLRRRDDGLDTYMWDIVDSDINQLRAWANARATVLRKKSKSFKVIDM